MKKENFKQPASADLDRVTIGWREWLALPDLGISAIKAKVDTGAKTSAIHAFEVESFQESGTRMVRFKIHPLQKRMDIILTCEAPVADQRMVTDSGGHREMRYVIRSTIILGNISKQIEITLTDRDSMLFRMLLGRSAMTKTFQVDPARSYLLGVLPLNQYTSENLK